MDRNRKWLGLCAVLALGLASTQAGSQEPLKLGGMVSLTGNGASIGKVAEIGWRMAVEDINAEGGIAGRPVEFILADTLTDPTHALGEARRLIENEQIEAMVGPVTSQEVIPVTSVTTAANLPQITAASSATLTPAAAPYHFSNSPTGLAQMIPNIDYALDVLGLTKLAIISDNGGMSKDAVAEMIAYLKTRELEPVEVQEFAFRTEDMTPQLFSLRSSGAEAVLIINSLGDDARKFLQNRDEIGWDVPVLGSLTMTNFSVGNAKILGREAFEGVNSVQFVGMTYCDGDPVGASAYARFDKRAKERVSDLERLGGSSSIIPYYIEPFIVKAAIEGAGSTDGDKVAAWIEANAATMDNMLGTFTASSETHFLPSAKTLTVVKNAFAPREDGLTERATCD
ncbi:ABC transporter substrate-binding protein [Stappia stellulata]|uniref:ABC transporter substrate-binding protein n=1 Tax=Stappia stellulata TaxID=71235 RepID=UPI00048CC584|nr:ABC transporter substrate-binding protein [Stappia stellulata]